MNIDEILDIYTLISDGISDIPSRKQDFLVRKRAFDAAQKPAMVKNAFDTRRIDQEVEYNPRRGLQNYNRSEQFVSEGLEKKIRSFSKLRDVLVDLKLQFGKDQNWQDSNARVLLSTLDKGLRIGINDGDFSENQPSMGSLDYIEELLHVRYRLGFDDLTKLGATDLKKIILSKDEELTHGDMNKDLHISKNDISTQTYDTLLEKLFGGIRATKDNPEVERTITITIKDKFVE
jgi:hypothetical protein